MKAKWLWVPLVLGLLPAAGCYVGGGGYVRAEPPVAAAVVVEPRPGFVWIDGHYYWGNAGWLWADGYWVAERPGYVYVQGSWVRGSGGYVWRDGYWSGRQTGGTVYTTARSLEGRSGGAVYNRGAAPAPAAAPVHGRPAAAPAAPAPARGGGVTVHDHRR